MTEECNDEGPGDLPQTASTPYNCKGETNYGQKMITKMGNKLIFGCGNGCLNINRVSN